MKGPQIPSRAQLSAAYEELQKKQPELTPDSVVRWAQWSRADARLGEILVNVLSKKFATLNPFEVWSVNRNADCPQALPVLMDFVGLLNSGEAILAWKKTAFSKLPKAPPQMFFVNDGMPKPHRDLKTMRKSLRPYRRWGYFGDADLAPLKGKLLKRTSMGTEERAHHLDELLLRGKPFSVDDYISQCDHRVHRRTAERDLRRCSGLRPQGFTRGRRYKPVQRGDR